jgi:hypothetical protein
VPPVGNVLVACHHHGADADRHEQRGTALNT